MNNSHCGMDFGTSNSTVGLHIGNDPSLAPVEGDKLTIPSAVFFDFDDVSTFFGRAAIAEYVDGADGRLMRGLKSVLGNSLIKEKMLSITNLWRFRRL